MIDVIFNLSGQSCFYTVFVFQHFIYFTLFVKIDYSIQNFTDIKKTLTMMVSRSQNPRPLNIVYLQGHHRSPMSFSEQRKKQCCTLKTRQIISSKIVAKSKQKKIYICDKKDPALSAAILTNERRRRRRSITRTVTKQRR